MLRKICSTRLLTIIVLLLIAWWIVSKTNMYKSIVSALSGPDLPVLQVKKPNSDEWMDQYWLNQGWGNSVNNPSADTKKYHHATQGTRTLPLPYDWFINLEQPTGSPFSILTSKQGKFVDNDYLLRFGFIRSDKDPVVNPDGLPIGFARTFSQNLLGVQGQTETIGFTCAACHTSHFVADNNEYIVEGGPAAIDMGLLQQALGASIGQTLLSSKIPIFDGRFDRFARNVLGQTYSPATKLSLRTAFQDLADAQLTVPQAKIQVIEGFTRIDALNRIGNAMFSENIERPENLSPIDAPVNYPHIWTSPWFDWVQYDASVMGPLVRNVGEALGLKAFLDVKSPIEDNRFSSSIPIDNLIWMEEFLSGQEPSHAQGFSGLRQPKWYMTDINQQLAEQGKALYTANCQGCHLPPLNSEDIFSKKHFDHIVWKSGSAASKPQTTPEKVLKLNVIPVSRIGTDPSQGAVMVNRTVDTSGQDNGPFLENKPGIGVDTDICIRDPNQQVIGNKPYELITAKISDGANLPFGYALAAVVEQTIDSWLELRGVTNETTKNKIKGDRPNCIQAGLGYKARPLDGMWATAPFLHNGSVASLRDLICPTDGERPRYVQLGSLDFDTENLGIKQPANYQKTAQKFIDEGKVYDDQGFFILDTQILGNKNTGHEFSNRYDSNKPADKQAKGVIGPAFNKQQCDALLEYLKTI